MQLYFYKSFPLVARMPGHNIDELKYDLFSFFRADFENSERQRFQENQKKLPLSISDDFFVFCILFFHFCFHHIFLNNLNELNRDIFNIENCVLFFYYFFSLFFYFKLFYMLVFISY